MTRAPRILQLLLVTLCTLSVSVFSSSTSSATDEFLGCLAVDIPPALLHTPVSPSYTPILLSSVRNLRFVLPGTPQPLAIVAPTEPAHVQAAVRCGRRHGVRVRVRSGGHDYEGLSYASVDRRERFAVLDLAALRDVRVDAARAEAWAGLAAVKARVDPDDFFRNEQSIPPLPAASAKGWSSI
ncbi:hypothetical protein EJB05_53263, partial [Eragrostis curvula]